MNSEKVAGKEKQHNHHHHHVFHISPLCPHHRPILQPSNHSHSLCSFSNSHNNLVLPFDSDKPNLSFPNFASMVLDESAELEVEDELDEEPTFVLTDEWREFFAKSEAKRRLAKKQAKKNKN